MGPEPVRFAVDQEEPVVLMPPDITFWGLTAELVLESENMTDTLIVADGTSCRHQIHDGAQREALHVARVLAMSLEAGAAP